MRIKTSLPQSLTLRELATEFALMAKGIVAGWGVEHTTDGRHAFPWVHPAPTSARFVSWTPTTITILKYQITGNTMRLVFDVTGTIGATPAAVSIPIPDGYRTPESCSAGMYAYSDAGTPGTGDAIAVGDRIDLYKNINATAWTAGTARAQGTIAFEVQ